jgi:hypothetical protein
MNETSSFYFHPSHNILIRDYLIPKIQNQPIPRLARDYFQNLGDVRSLDKNITRILRTYPIPQPQKCARLYFFSRKISCDDEPLTNNWLKEKRHTQVKVDRQNYSNATFYDKKDEGGSTWRMSVLEAYNNRAISPRRLPGLDLNWCIIEVCKLSTKKGDSLTFNLSRRVIVRRRRDRGRDNDRTPRRRSGGRIDHEVPLDTKVRTETSEQHDAAVQDSPLPGQRHSPRWHGREVMNMNNSHPTQVSSLPNQRCNRRRRNMNDPINSSTIITTQSTTQPET